MGGRGSVSSISGNPVTKGGQGYSTMHLRKVTPYVGTERLRKMLSWKDRLRVER